MKAVSPLRSRPGSGGLLPGLTTRSKSPVPPEEEQVLSDMERCYRLLRAMVPGLAPDQSLSRVDILQHVIDYILDLQTALEPGPMAGCQQNQNPRDHENLPGQQNLPWSPPSAVTSDVRALTFQRLVARNRARRKRDAALTRSLNPDPRTDRQTFSTGEAGLQATRCGRKEAVPIRGCPPDRWSPVG
ncbi:unnamed protein product [Lota lota]